MITRRKTIRVRLRSTNPSPRSKQGNRSRFIEGGGVTDDHYAKLIHHLAKTSQLGVSIDTVVNG